MKKTKDYKKLKSTKELPIKTIGKSAVVGVFAGIVITFYRIVLSKGEELSFSIYEFVRTHPIWIIGLFLCLGVAGFLTGTLKQKYPMIGGSGIPQVKGIILGYFKQSWIGTLIAKFLGGTLGIVAGLSLGREGPSIQLGACIGEGVGNKIAKSPTERKVLIAGGASAGLAAAFHAPLAGTMFVLEEIYRYFSPAVLLSTMVSAMIGDFISKTVFGLRPVFDFKITSSFPLSQYWMLVVLGIIAGFAGVLYNATLKQTQKIYDKMKHLSQRGKIMIPFFLAGVLGLLFPIVLGGGHPIIGKIQMQTGIGLLLLIFIIKFLFSMVSFGSGAPGGIFFPLLVLGAIIGGVTGKVCIIWFGASPELFQNFVVLAMVAYFTAIVRAPLTGIVLLLEMTGSFSNLLSMLVVAVFAYMTSELLKSEPIYEYLLDKQVENLGEIPVKTEEKILIQSILHHGAQGENQQIKDLQLPSSCLLISIERGSNQLIPKGDTKVVAGDTLIFLVPINQEATIRRELEVIVEELG